jgi:flagellar basal body-associated protein FliL
VWYNSVETITEADKRKIAMIIPVLLVAIVVMIAVYALYRFVFVNLKIQQMVTKNTAHAQR